MKKLLILFISAILASCTEMQPSKDGAGTDERVTVKSYWDNKQPRSTIYRAIDEKNSYYEINYDSLGRLETITPFSDSLKNGTLVFFRDNSEVGALLNFKNGVRDGYTYEFHKGLQTMFKGESRDGKFNGVSTWYHDNGTLKESGVRTNSKSEGEWVEYYKNGNLKSKGTFVLGVAQKDWIYWNEDGTIDSTKSK